jgi:hypothetical protein
VATYVGLAFAISWGGLPIVVGASGIPGTIDEIERLMGVAIAARMKETRS